MPNRRMSSFESIDDVQEWLLAHGIFQSHPSLASMWNDPKFDYKMVVTYYQNRWHVKFHRRQHLEEEIENGT